MGTNDLRLNAEPEEIANGIVNTAALCKESVCKIIVSAILPRGDTVNEKWETVNEKKTKSCV